MRPLPGFSEAEAEAGREAERYGATAEVTDLIVRVPPVGRAARAVHAVLCCAVPCRAVPSLMNRGVLSCAVLAMPGAVVLCMLGPPGSPLWHYCAHITGNRPHVHARRW